MKKILFITSVFTITFWLASCIGSGKNSDIETSSQEDFPQMEGINLEGKIIKIPDQFAGKTNLVIVAYLREQQLDVDTWIAKLDKLNKIFPDLQFYELPVIDKSSAIFRFYVNNGMRRGIKDSKQRKLVITVYTDVKEFLQLTSMKSVDEIAVFLLDSNGKIIAKTSGKYSEDKVREFQNKYNK
jgi:hypothetical protein